RIVESFPPFALHLRRGRTRQTQVLLLDFADLRRGGGRVHASRQQKGGQQRAGFLEDAHDALFNLAGRLAATGLATGTSEIISRDLRPCLALATRISRVSRLIKVSTSA